MRPWDACTQGDLFGNSGKDNTQGLLYLSRMDPSRDPKKTRFDTLEEQKRRSLAQLAVKEGEDVVAEKEVGGVTSGTIHSSRDPVYSRLFVRQNAMAKLVRRTSSG